MRRREFIVGSLMLIGAAACRRGGGSPVPPFSPGYYLDAVSVGFAAAFSLRKMFAGASTCLRVRRASDNAEQDIGFSGEAIDVVAIEAFCAGSSGYIRTFYDQSGSGAHAQQATVASQPMIVDGGDYTGVAKFDGEDDFLTVSGLAFGTPYLGIYERLYHPTTASSKIIAEGSANFNSNGQTFLHFAGFFSGNNFLSLNANNGAGQQRAYQYIFTPSGPNTKVCLIDRTITGSSEMVLYRDGVAISPSSTPGTTELTGNFSSQTVYIGARGGSSLFSNMELDTMMFTFDKSAHTRPAIESAIKRDAADWRSRLNAPTTMFKIGSNYFVVDCWHHRVLFSDDPAREVWAWDTLDEDRLVGPHSIATDGSILVVDSSDGAAVHYYNASTLAWIGSIAMANRPHRINYDSTTSAFYVVRSGSKQIVKLARSGMTLSVAHTVTLSFLGDYVRSFRIIDGEMVFIDDDGTINAVSFDGTSGGYAQTGTYSLPGHMTDCNDVFKASSGKWYATSWDPAMIEFDSLAAMDGGTYVDVLSSWGIAGLPYWVEEFDGALWIGNIVHHNGIQKRTGGVTTTIHDYGDENASSLDRHYNP